MSKIYNTYRLIQAFSIDVAIGACFMCWLTSYVLNVDTPISTYFCLGATVWLIYTIDHLIDAKEIRGEAITLRHRIHQQYFKAISYFWIFFFGIVLTISLVVLPEKTIYYGVGVTGIVVVHLVLVKLLGNKLSVFIHKELGVALGYTLGVIFGPVSLVDTWNSSLLIFVSQLLLLSLINLHLFSYFDYEIDVAQNQTSVSRNMGKNGSKQLIIVLFILYTITQFVGFSLYLNTPFLNVQILLSIMALILISLILFPNFFSVNDRYRIAGDGIFLFPAILLLFT